MSLKRHQQVLSKFNEGNRPPRETPSSNDSEILAELSCPPGKPLLGSGPESREENRTGGEMEKQREEKRRVRKGERETRYLDGGSGNIGEKREKD